jgi:hypothetical protein
MDEGHISDVGSIPGTLAQILRQYGEDVSLIEGSGEFRGPSGDPLSEDSNFFRAGSGPVPGWHRSFFQKMQNLGGRRFTRFDPGNRQVLAEQLIRVRDRDTALSFRTAVTIPTVPVQEISSRQGQIATPLIFLRTS